MVHYYTPTFSLVLFLVSLIFSVFLIVFFAFVSFLEIKKTEGKFFLTILTHRLNVYNALLELGIYNAGTLKENRGGLKELKRKAEKLKKTSLKL